MTSAPTVADICIIGGGIAGAGAAYEIAPFASVILLERESQCGLHATGRSAASFSETYGNGIIRRLAVASRGFLADPPTGFCDFPLLVPRGTLTIARAEPRRVPHPSPLRDATFPGTGKDDRARFCHSLPIT